MSSRLAKPSRALQMLPTFYTFPTSSLAPHSFIHSFIHIVTEPGSKLGTVSPRDTVVSRADASLPSEAWNSTRADS